MAGSEIQEYANGNGIISRSFIIRADGNGTIGLGHIMRCLSIADSVVRLYEGKVEVRFVLADEGVSELISQRGYECSVLRTDYREMEGELPSWEELWDFLGKIGFLADAPIIVVDSYFVTRPYLLELKKSAERLVYIDDLAAFPYPVDVLVNYNAYAKESAYVRLYREAIDMRPAQETIHVRPHKEAIDMRPAQETIHVRPHQEAINGQFGQDLACVVPRMVLGVKYAPLRSMFRGIPRKGQRERVENVLISTGGADPNHLAISILEAINENLGRKMRKRPDGLVYHFLVGRMSRDAERIKSLSETKMLRDRIVVHQNVSDMRSLIEACDLAVSAAGSTLYEICACGVPFVTYVTADNQIPGAEAFEGLGLAVYAGDIRECADTKMAAQKLLDCLDELSMDFYRRKEVGRRMQQMVDGYGADRMVQKIMDR